MTSIRRRANNPSNVNLNPWTKRRVFCWSMFVLAFIIAIQHIFAHQGFKPIPISMGWQDIFLGYPMSFLIVFVGLFSLDPSTKG
jgi:hypothetical protein